MADQKQFFDKGRVSIVSLGCARNLVDSQEFAGRVRQRGYTIVPLPEAPAVILNTCGFISDAREESVDAILDLIALKKEGWIRKIIVAGCLVQRYGRELLKEFPELDALIGVPLFLKDRVPEQINLTPAHWAYVKICEGCFNFCGFCAIPRIKGPIRSRRIEAVLADVASLDREGVKEINLIGQDITAYGTDLYGERSLDLLLREIVKAAEKIEWVRLLYMFPAHVTEPLIDLIAGEERICKYFDIPLQHISDKLLKRMNRPMSAARIRDLLKKIRDRIPEACLRTAFIVGLPGETKSDFEELLDFVREMRFQRMGVFQYSREEGTPAYSMPGQVPPRVKQERFDILMQEQKKISQDILKGFVGKTFKVLIDEGQEDKNLYTGRTPYDAPDVDGTVIVHSPRRLETGTFVDVRVTEALDYDLEGVAV